MSDAQKRKTELTTLQSQVVQNLLLERRLWLQQQLDPRRDIEQECGHPLSPTVQDYHRLFTRGDVAARVVKVWPEESWSERPQVYENEDPEDTTFEKEWKRVDREHACLSTLLLGDILSGIGRFGIVLLGIGDGKNLSDAAEGVTNDDSIATPARAKSLLYLRAFDETCVTINELEKDKSNPRYGLPISYNIAFQDSTLSDGVAASTEKVHWSRVIHLADNRMSSRIYGLPRMELVLNRLLDAKKIAGGSGEMFWKGGFPGLSMETMPDVLNNGNVQLDTDSLKTQIDAYMNGLQRYIATVGMKANSLSPQVADPSPHWELQLRTIAAALSIPWRIFIGSETAQLASEQDSRTWNRRVTRRREDYLSPYIIYPFVRRLVQVGILPKPANIFVSWPDLNTPSEKDRAVVAEGLTKALTLYVTSGADAFMTPFHFLTLVMRFSDEEAASMVAKMQLLEQIRTQAIPNAQAPGGSSQSAVA